MHVPLNVQSKKVYLIFGNYIKYLIFNYITLFLINISYFAMQINLVKLNFLEMYTIHIYVILMITNIFVI